jgi:hypothetical protein
MPRGLHFEREFVLRGITRIAGVDAIGRVILPKDCVTKF